MSAAAWATGAQILLSAATGVATVVVGFAVYRLQADKLFLEMRGERLASLNRFRSAASQRFQYIMSIKFENFETSIIGEAHEAMMRAYWDAERDLSLWFGPDVSDAGKAVEAALAEYEHQAIKFQAEMAPRRDLSAHQRAVEAMGVADKTMDKLITAAHRYIAAGRRGLSWGDRFRLWRLGRRRVAARLSDA